MKIHNHQIDQLVKKAWEVRKNAYTPYFHFPVGAALLTNQNEIFSGCNVENAVPTASVCAEGTAIGNAISQGRKMFKAVAIVGQTNDYVFPCGICRQRLLEFNPEIDIYLACKKKKKVLHFALKELLPHSFAL